MGEVIAHAPYVYEHHGVRLGTGYRAECPCGWAGVTWFSRANAANDVERHADQATASGESAAYRKQHSAPEQP